LHCSSLKGLCRPLSWELKSYYQSMLLHKNISCSPTRRAS
jgi:hypothetical protein